MICRHCKKLRVNRPRGLCRGCYYSPLTPGLYPITSKYARRGFGNFTAGAPLPSGPTGAAPGTPEKVAVMEQRVRSNRAPFHPADALFEGDPRPVEFLTTHRLFAVPVTVCTGTLPEGPTAAEPAFATRTFVVGESPLAPGLPDVAELKERVAEWKRETGLTPLE